MLDENISGLQYGDFKLGKPALVCRWRISGGALPLENRHMRALSRRELGEKPVSPQLVAWAKEHVDWTLKEGSAEHPDGVLMLVVDDQGCAAMTVGAYEPLPRTSLDAIARRAFNAGKEAEKTGVAPETLWVVQEDHLIWGLGRGDAPSGSSSLINDLVTTVGFTVIRDPELVSKVRNKTIDFSEAFLVSDEHGVVPASNWSGARSQRFVVGYQKLFK